jgi:hypothetical protein
MSGASSAAAETEIKQREARTKVSAWNDDTNLYCRANAASIIASPSS